MNREDKDAIQIGLAALLEHRYGCEVTAGDDEGLTFSLDWPGASGLLSTLAAVRAGNFHSSLEELEAASETHAEPALQKEAAFCTCSNVLNGHQRGCPYYGTWRGYHHPLASPNYGDRLREEISRARREGYNNGILLLNIFHAEKLADAIDADAKESAEAFLALSRVNSRAHMEGNAEAAEWQVTLRQRIEAAVDQLRYTSLVAGTEILRDVVDHDELIAALAEIFGPAAAKESP